jgi:hypothetical protein
VATAGVLVDGLGEHEYLEDDEYDDDDGSSHQHRDYPNLEIILKK